MLQRILHVFRGAAGVGAIVSNIGWLLADKLMRIFVSLVASLWVARYLGPEEFGYLSYAQNFVIILSAVSGLGLDAIVLRELSRRESESAVILGSAFLLKGIGALLVFSALITFVGFGGIDENNVPLVLVIALGMFFQGFGLVEVYFQSLVKSKYTVVFGLAAVLLSSLVKVVLIVIEADLFWFAASYFLDVFFYAIALVCCYCCIAGKGLLAWSFKLREAAALFRDSWALMIGGLAFVVFYSFDFLMIQASLGGYEVGIYAAAFKFCVIWHFVPGVVINSFKPSVVKSMGTPAYQAKVELVTGLLLWFAIVIFVAAWFAADLLISLAYGADYSRAADVLRVMIFSNIFVFFFSCWNSWHIIEGRSGYVMASNLLAVFIKLVLAFFLLEDAGLRGLVFFGMFGMCLSFIVFSLNDRKTFILAMNAFLFPLRYRHVKD